MTSVSGVLYIGVTNDLGRRVWEHKTGAVAGFTKRYKCHQLVWYEGYGDVNAAITREKQLKGWTRARKEGLVREMNPAWRDLAMELNA